MKKLLLIALLSGAARLTYAQTAFKAGTVELGGGVNYAHQEEEIQNGGYTSAYRTNTLAVSPYLGYFVKNNLSVGLSVSYAIRETKYSYNYSPSSQPSYQTISSLRLGPYVRYYRMLTEQFGFTGTLSGGYARNFQSGQSGPGVGTGDTKATGFYASLTPGIIFLPIPRLGIGASIGNLGYTRLNVGADGSSSSASDVQSTFGAGFGLDQLTFSGTYFFGR